MTLKIYSSVFFGQSELYRLLCHLYVRSLSVNQSSLATKIHFRFAFKAAKSLVYPLLLLCLSVIWYYYAIYSDRKKNLLDIPGPTPLPLIGIQ